MTNQFPAHPEEVAKRFLRKEWGSLTDREQHVLGSFIKRRHISRNVHLEMHDDRTLGERVADRVAAFGGSWKFIFIFVGILIAWVILNTIILAKRGAAFDPYPYILLNLFLSMIAALQAPIIMMSQNRQAARDRADAAHDYEVNLKAELEILGLHEKLDELRDQKWRDLIAMQQEQINLLTQLVGNGQDN